MNILLTHGYFLEEDGRERRVMRPYPPLGILYLSAYLERNGIDHYVFDTTFSSRKELQKFLLDHRPSLIGIYVNLMTKPNVLEIIRFIRAHLKSTVILGGPEVRSHAHSFLDYGADYVVLGEGEATLLELVQHLERKEDPERLKDVRGIGFRLNGKNKVNPERELIGNLDQLPFPNRKKIDMDRYLQVWKKHHGQNAISVSTMRGCPYTCKWCSRSVYGLSYRRRSAVLVVEEIRMIQRDYNPDTLWFVDDVFTINHRWLRAFRDELKRGGVSIRYECITRADRLNEEAVRLLRESGCFRVWIGAESGSQKVIDLMDRRVDVQQVSEMIRLCKREGIETGTFIMLGYPGETEADIEATITHLKRSDPDHFTITIAYPIAGTELYDEIKEIQVQTLDWATTTDRDIDFRRTYPRKFYDFAVRRVVNEVNASKKIPLPSRIGAKMKSLVAKAGMYWVRHFSTA